MKNKLADLRNILFETLEHLTDPDSEFMTPERAHAIAQVAKIVVDSAKIEERAAKAANVMPAAWILGDAPQVMLPAPTRRKELE